MDLDQRADAIAMQAIKDAAATGLRALSPSDRTQRIVDCLDTLSRLLDTELDGGDLARFAATALYRANYYLDRLLAYETSLGVFLTAMEQANQGRTGRTEKIKAAIAKLHRKGSPLVSMAFQLGQDTGASLSASASGKQGKAVSEEVKAYAIRLYDAGTWKNPSQARHRLLPQVVAEAKRLKWSMSPTEAPTTLYRWLRQHDKNMRSTS